MPVNFNGAIVMISTIGAVLVLGVLVFVLYEVIKELE